jgi:hypothetical protein
MINMELVVYLPADTEIRLSKNSPGDTADLDIVREDTYAPSTFCHVLNVEELRLLAKQFSLMADIIETGNPSGKSDTYVAEEPEDEPACGRIGCEFCE